MLMKWLFILIVATAPFDSLSDSCQHPPLAPLDEKDKHVKYTGDVLILNTFRLHKLGLGYYADIAENNKNSTIDTDFLNTIRNSDPDNPGNYFDYSRGSVSVVGVDSTDRTFLEKLLSKYLAPEFYSKAILDSIDNVYLDEFKRKEFYFEAIVNNTRLRFSGWYGKFVHIFVFTEFDSKQSFIKQAERFFNLSSLEPAKFSYDEERVQDKWDDFFYSYDDQNAGFKLYGYPYLKMNVTDDSVEYFIDGAILDLTIYPEED